MTKIGGEINMPQKFFTAQEMFWAGKFGTEYIRRNKGGRLLASNLAFFSRALKSVSEIKSCIEFGANVGMNLKALKLLCPELELDGIEINGDATELLAQVIPSERVHHTSILEFQSNRTWDLVLIKGVLIHIDPNMLANVYEKLVGATNRYLLISEYYNPTPESIAYRGHSDRLFKRDFAGEILDRYPQMKLVDYGFIYHGDLNFPQDDTTWFLLEKR